MRVYGCYNDLCVYENFTVDFKREGIIFSRVDTSIVEDFPLCQLPPVPAEEWRIPEACRIPGALHFTRSGVEVVESCDEYGEASCMEKHDVLLYLMTYSFYAVSRTLLYLILYNNEVAYPVPFYVKSYGEISIEDFILAISSESPQFFFKKNWVNGRMEAVGGIYLPLKDTMEVKEMVAMLWSKDGIKDPWFQVRTPQESAFISDLLEEGFDPDFYDYNSYRVGEDRRGW